MGHSVVPDMYTAYINAFINQKIYGIPGKEISSKLDLLFHVGRH